MFVCPFVKRQLFGGNGTQKTTAKRKQSLARVVLPAWRLLENTPRYLLLLLTCHLQTCDPSEDTRYANKLYPTTSNRTVVARRRSKRQIRKIGISSAAERREYSSLGSSALGAFPTLVKMQQDAPLGRTH